LQCFSAQMKFARLESWVGKDSVASFT
jgi:hypothetical protein